jgi:RHS repeat-associated protein
MPGDQVSIQAYAKYNTPSGTATNFTGFVASLLSAFNLPTPAPGELGTPAAGVNAFGNWEMGATGDENKSDAMKIFATIIMFDRNYNLLDVAYQAIQANGSLSATYKAKQPGYAYLYISNEHPTLADVYFDDVTISFIPSPVVQQEDYYPFGLTFNSYTRENTVPQNFLYNGKELQKDLGLNWEDYGARMYMGDIGRWGVVDPLAEISRRWSPYSYAYDDPISFVDVDGMFGESMKDRADQFLQNSMDTGDGNRTMEEYQNAQTDNEGNRVYASDIESSFSSDDYRFGVDRTDEPDDPRKPLKSSTQYFVRKFEDFTWFRETRTEVYTGEVQITQIDVYIFYNEDGQRLRRISEGNTAIVKDGEVSYLTARPSDFLAQLTAIDEAVRQGKNPYDLFWTYNEKSVAEKYYDLISSRNSSDKKKNRLTVGAPHDGRAYRRGYTSGDRPKKRKKNSTLPNPVSIKGWKDK